MTKRITFKSRRVSYCTDAGEHVDAEIWTTASGHCHVDYRIGEGWRELGTSPALDHYAAAAMLVAATSQAVVTQSEAKAEQARRFEAQSAD